MAWAFYACFIILAAIKVSCKHICEGSAGWQELSYVQVHSLVDFFFYNLQKKKKPVDYHVLILFPKAI